MNRPCLDWMFVSLQNSYVETLPLNVMVLGIQPWGGNFARSVEFLNGIRILIRRDQVSLVAQLVKNPPPMQETQETCVRSLGQEDPLEKKMATHSSTLAWTIPQTNEPGGLQFMRLQRVKRNWETEHTFTFLINVLHLVSRMSFSLSFFPSFLVIPSQFPCLDSLLPDFLVWNIRVFLFFFPPLCLHICMVITVIFTPLGTNTPKRCPFHYRGLECRSRKSRNIWSNRQIWPWNAKWSRAKANRVLPRECTGHSKHPLPTTWEKTLHKDITRWSTLKSDWLYSLQPKMEKLYTVNQNKTRSWLWLRSWTPYCHIQT